MLAAPFQLAGTRLWRLHTENVVLYKKHMIVALAERNVRREKALLAIAAVIVIAVIGGVMAIPGGIDDPRADSKPAGDLSVVGQAIDPGSVSGSTVQLRLVTDIEHRDGPVENVTVRYRAVDADSGILVDERHVEVGTVDIDGEKSIEGEVELPREGGYELTTTVYAGNKRVSTASTRVSGVAGLRPEYVSRSLQFADTDIYPTLSVSVADVSDGQATLRVTAAITNTGDTAAEGTELAILLRQAESNVIGNRATTSIDSIRPGRTEYVFTTVTVPDEYNYYIDSVLRNDDVIVDEAGDVANLNPKKTIQANQTVETVQFKTSDFSDSNSEAASDSTPTPESDGTPGFGVIVAVMALLIAVLLARGLR